MEGCAPTAVAYCSITRFPRVSSGSRSRRRPKTRGSCLTCRCRQGFRAFGFRADRASVGQAQRARPESCCTPWARVRATRAAARGGSGVYGGRLGWVLTRSVAPDQRTSPLRGPVEGRGGGGGSGGGGGGGVDGNGATAAKRKGKYGKSGGRFRSPSGRLRADDSEVAEIPAGT